MVNSVMLLGRLTRDVEGRNFQNGGKVAAFGLAVNGRKKNPTTQQWEDDPVFIDCELFGSAEHSVKADLALSSLHKGSLIFLEGRLKLDQWTDQQGGKRSKLKVVVEDFQFLEPKPQGQQQSAPAQPSYGPPDAEPPLDDPDAIPF